MIAGEVCSQNELNNRQRVPDCEAALRSQRNHYCRVEIAQHRARVCGALIVCAIKQLVREWPSNCETDRTCARGVRLCGDDDANAFVHHRDPTQSTNERRLLAAAKKTPNHNSREEILTSRHLADVQRWNDDEWPPRTQKRSCGEMLML